MVAGQPGDLMEVVTRFVELAVNRALAHALAQVQPMVVQLVLGQLPLQDHATLTHVQVRLVYPSHMSYDKRFII